MDPFNERPRRWQALAAVAASMFLLATLGPLLVGLVGRAGLRYTGLALTELLCIGAPAILLALLGHRRGQDPVWLFRLGRPRASFGALAAPLALVSAGGFALAQTSAEWMQRLMGPGHAPDWEAYAPRTGAELAAALLAMALSPAVSEELLFRGYVLRGLEVPRHTLHPSHDVRTSLIVGALFAAAHLSPAVFPSHLFLGAVITFVVLRADSIVAGMAIHAAGNGLTIVLWHSSWLERLPDSAASNVAAAALLVFGLWWMSALTKEGG